MMGFFYNRIHKIIVLIDVIKPFMIYDIILQTKVKP